MARTVCTPSATGVSRSVTLLVGALLASTGAILGCGGGGSSGGFTPLTDGGSPPTDASDSGHVGDSSTPAETASNQLASPTFAPVSGTSFQGSGLVTITGPTGATICYTTDGTIPNPAQCKAYVGPVQVSVSETITALATETGFITSAAVQASYVVTAGDGGSGGPVFNPPATSENNDFLVQITGPAGETLCYTIDGSTPTCSATGQCTGTSQAYDAATGGISIDGMVTDPTTGKVQVIVIECEAGQTPSAPTPQAYQLVVADPTMTLGGTNVPATTGLSNVPWPSGQTGLTPIVQTLTVNSTVVTDNVSIRYATGTAIPTCQAGTQITSPTTFNGTAASTNPALVSNTTYNTIGCKQGYAPSTAVSFPFTILLATPTVPAATNPYSSVPTITIGDTGNSTGGSGQADTLCFTHTAGTTGATPTCGASGGCGTNSTSASTFQPGNGTSPSTTVEAIACPPTTNPNLVASAPTAAVTYTLQLAQPFIASGDTAGGSTGLPGWGYAAAGSGTPNTSFNIPPVAASPYPTSDTGASCSAHDSQAIPHCVWQIGQVQPMPACGGNEFYLTATTIPAGCTPSTAATYYCYTTTAGATAGCGATAGTCTGTGAVAITATTGAGAAAPTNLVVAGVATAGLNAKPGTPDTLSLVACQNPGAAVVYGASAPTNVGPVNPAGSATQPTANPAGGAQSTQAVVTVTNADPNPSMVCFTVDGTTPTCSLAGGKATCGGTGTTWCGQNGAPPATGAATCTTSVSSSVLALNSSFTIPSVLPATTNEFLQANTAVGSTLNAVTCNTAEAPSAVYTAPAFAFTMAPPDFGAAPQVNGAPGDTTWDTSPASPVGAGAPVWLSTISNFDFNSATNPAISIHWAWGATPTCTTTAATCPTGALSCGSVSPGSFSTSATTKQVVSNWSATAAGVAQGFTFIPTPATGNSVTLQAIACGQAATLQATSKVSQVTFTVQTAVPILVTNEACVGTVAECGTGCNASQFPVAAAAGGSTAQLQEEQGNVCPAIPTWERSIKFQVADATGLATICYTTDGVAPHCTAGQCNAGSTHVTDTTGVGPITATLVVDGTTTNLESNIQVQVAACTANLAEVDMTPVLFVLQTSPVDFYDGTGKAVKTGATLACGLANATDVAATSVEAAQDAAPTTYQAGGPTPNECICYTTDGSQPILAACSAALTCAAATTAGTTCATVNATSGGALGTVASVSVDEAVTINYATCVAGLKASYNGVTGSNPYLVTPYTHTIAVDGSTVDWSIAGQNGFTLNDEGGAATLTAANAKNGLGLFTYDSATLYFGFLNTSGNGTVALPLGIQVASGNQVGLLIGNGITTGAPQTLPSAAGFPATTLQTGEGALYFVTWPVNSADGTTATVYEWSGGAWAPTAVTVTAKAGTTNTDTDFEMSIPLASLPLLGAPASQVTLMGIFATGIATATPATQFSWWSAGSAEDDGWFNDFLGSCVAPAFKNVTVPAGVINANPGQ